MCGAKNFVSVRLYSAPQSHWTIVAILGICAYGLRDQAEFVAKIKQIQSAMGPGSMSASELPSLSSSGNDNVDLEWVGERRIERDQSNATPIRRSLRHTT